ncbi:PAS domain-containing protein [Thauera humireducens]|uniref:PAS domain-containing protein n=1 Tax=Thauera humireducens TaxID=1134435 RepID=UPI00311F17DC
MFNLFRSKRALDVIDAIEQTQAVIEFDLQGTILRANKRFLDLLGYSPDEVRGRSHRMFLHPSDAKGNDYQAFWQALRAGKPQTGSFAASRRRAPRSGYRRPTRLSCAGTRFFASSSSLRT